MTLFIAGLNPNPQKGMHRDFALLPINSEGSQYIKRDTDFAAKNTCSSL
jgi:hypothetical protein